MTFFGLGGFWIGSTFHGLGTRGVKGMERFGIKMEDSDVSGPCLTVGRADEQLCSFL